MPFALRRFQELDLAPPGAFVVVAELAARWVGIRRRRGRPAERALQPLALRALLLLGPLLRNREILRRVRGTHVSTVLRGDLHHDAVGTARFLLRGAAARPPPDETRAEVAELGGGGVVLVLHRGSVPALHRGDWIFLVD